MDKRLTVLETRFDTILPTLATKSDLEALRAEVQVGFKTLQVEFRGEHEKLRGEVRGENEKLRGDVSGEIVNSRGEMRSENEKLRAEIQKELSNHTKFLIGVMISLFIGALAVNINMFNALNSRLVSIESRLSATQQSSTPVGPPSAPPQTNAKAQ